MCPPQWLRSPERSPYRVLAGHMGRPVTRAPDPGQVGPALFVFALHSEPLLTSIPDARPETTKAANLSGDRTPWNPPPANGSILRTRAATRKSHHRARGTADLLAPENSRAPFAMSRAKGANSRGTTLLPASVACAKMQALACCNGLPVEAYVRWQHKYHRISTPMLRSDLRCGLIPGSLSAGGPPSLRAAPPYSSPSTQMPRIILVLLV